MDFRTSLAALAISGSPLCMHSAAALPGDAAHPFPQHVAYAAGTIKPNHRSQAQLDADVALAYDQWKANYVKAAGTAPDGLPMYRVSFGTSNPNRTVSEGQGFGMIAAALMAGHDPDARTIFDGLWRFTSAHPSKIDSRLMAWQVPESGGGDASAFDGDCDMAYGLLLAHAQWGSAGGAGTWNYAAEFEVLMAGILESTIGPQSRLPMLGDWVQPNGSPHSQWSPRTSDLMHGHFAAFARATNDPVWSLVKTNSQSVVTTIQTSWSAATGLLPDFCVPASGSDHTPKPAPAGFLEGANDGNYYYNAFRDPWRIGVDALVNDDATSFVQIRRIADWIFAATGGSWQNLRAGYALDGTPLPNSNYFTTVVAAPFAVAAMSRPAQQAWLNALYDKIYAAHENYYEDSVALLSLLVITGNWWDPTLVADACSADLNASGAVDGGDIAILLGAWGPAPAGTPADLDASGAVDGGDITLLLGAWGDCAE